MSPTFANQIRDLPEVVALGLSRFVESSRVIFGEDLKSVVLFGSGAEGRLRPASDVNVILILTSFDSTKAGAIRAPYAAAQAAIRLKAMFLLESELPQVLISFGQKFSDVLRRHQVLYGPDPLVGANIPRSAIILRLRQVLLNLMLRLREGYVEQGATQERVSELIAEAAGPLRSCAATLLELEGKSAASPKEALVQFVATLPASGWDEILAHVSDARERRELPAALADKTVIGLIELTARLAARVACLD